MNHSGEHKTQGKGEVRTLEDRVSEHAKIANSRRENDSRPATGMEDTTIGEHLHPLCGMAWNDWGGGGMEEWNSLERDLPT